MKKVFFLATILFLLLPLFSLNLRVLASPIGEYPRKRVIADKIDEATIRLFERKGCFLKHTLKQLASFECPEEVIPQLNVRESRIFHIMDLDTDKQIGADKVWAEGIDGNSVNVAVLDTGIDTDHPELQDSYLGGYDYVNNDSSPEDDHGHGTHVVGIITANGVSDGNSKGVAPGAGIYMYKVCNASGNCYEDDIMAALEAVVGTNAKVVSISIGAGSYKTENCDADPLAAKINWVVGQGLTVAVAAGNDGRGVSSPGCASGAIAVGAVDKSNNVPYWSGRGPATDIVAPGVDLYSSLIGGYGYKSGTSISTPHVSGVAALLLETDSSLSTGEIKTALYNTATSVNKCYQCSFWWGSRCFRQREVVCNPEITGAGVVNAYEAYLAVKPAEPACFNDTDCDDGLYCNGAEMCLSGVCQSGTPVDCSSLSDQCNKGVCDEVHDTCIVEPKVNGTVCEDGLFCTVDDYCSSGSCVSGPERTCDDHQECTADSCNEESKVCANDPVEDNTVCIEGLCCSGTCAPATCSEGIDCDDGDACTRDVCENAGTCSASCTYEPIAVCTDNDGCCPASCDYTNDNDCSEEQPILCWSGDFQYLYRNSSQLRKFCKCAQETYGYSSYSYRWGRRTAYRYVDEGDNENWETSSRSSYLSVYQVACPDGVKYPTNKDYFYGK